MTLRKRTIEINVTYIPKNGQTQCISKERDGKPNVIKNRKQNKHI